MDGCTDEEMEDALKHLKIEWKEVRMHGRTTTNRKFIGAREIAQKMGKWQKKEYTKA